MQARVHFLLHTHTHILDAVLSALVDDAVADDDAHVNSDDDPNSDEITDYEVDPETFDRWTNRKGRDNREYNAEMLRLMALFDKRPSAPKPAEQVDGFEEFWENWLKGRFGCLHTVSACVCASVCVCVCAYVRVCAEREVR